MGDIFFLLMFILLTLSLFFTRNYKKDYFSSIRDKKTVMFLFYSLALWIDDKLDWIYLRIRKKSKYDHTVLEKVRSVYLFENPLIQAKFIQVKKWSSILLCLMVGLALATVFSITEKDNSNFEVEQLRRPSFGDGDTSYEVTVKGIDESDISLDINVTQQLPDQEVMMQIFDKKIEEVKEKICGENKSLNEVRTKLNLITSTKEGIRISWDSLDTDWINAWGEIVAEKIPEEGHISILRARLSYAGYESHYEITVKLLPPIETRSYLIQRFKAMLNEKNNNEVKNQFLSLPSNWEGRKIAYRLKKENESIQICGVSILVAFCIASFCEKSIDEKRKKRNRELMLDYATIISKLTLLLHAGLTVHLAWERVVKDYQTQRESGKKEMRYVYEEMSQVYYKIEGGSSEILEYREFGKNCGLHPYQKLVNILEQYITQGSSDTEKLLSDEMYKALENRKNEAIKMGEEANLKLLIPMLLMLGIVLIILMLPAFMSFQF